MPVAHAGKQRRRRGAAAGLLALLVVLQSAGVPAVEEFDDWGSDDAGGGQWQQWQQQPAPPAQPPAEQAHALFEFNAGSNAGPGTTGVTATGAGSSSSSSSQGSSSWLWGKKEQLQPGFSGGFGPRQRLCNNPSLAGCQSCSGDVCTACFSDLGLARFVFNPDSGTCECPPGFGIVPDDAIPWDWDPLPRDTAYGWDRRRLLAEPAAAVEPAGAAEPAAAAEPAGAAEPASSSHHGGGHLALPAQQPMPPPVWATSCLPCPKDWFSPGGAIGFAQCKPCPGSWTTGNLTASASCMVPYCGPGQQPNRRAGTCQPCPFGTFSSSAANNGYCTPCRANLTTPAVGSTSEADCRVPICPPGSELDRDLFVCMNCTGNTFSPGGVRRNGPYQAPCIQCPDYMAAVNHTVCRDDVCPPADAFAIICNASNIPDCGPNAKPIALNRFCKAYPPGAQLSWFQGVISSDPVSVGPPTFTVTTLGDNLVDPPIVECPSAANGSNVFYPYITGFNNRTTCRCDSTTASCLTPAAVATSNPNINITIPDPQLTSLRRLLGAMDPEDYYNMTTRFGDYCTNTLDQAQYGLYTSCTGPASYLTSVVLTPPSSPTTGAAGTLPPAYRLPGLTHLTHLTCGTNCSLTGTLPPDWGTSNNLLALRYLNLAPSGNLFTGSLPPSWGGLGNLVNLTLSTSNSLTGGIPWAWRYMRSLQYADLTGADIASACAPRSWRTYNGLVRGVTLLPSTLEFCTSDTATGSLLASGATLLAANVSEPASSPAPVSEPASPPAPRRRRVPPGGSTLDTPVWQG